MTNSHHFNTCIETPLRFRKTQQPLTQHDTYAMNAFTLDQISYIRSQRNDFTLFKTFMT